MKLLSEHYFFRKTPAPFFLTPSLSPSVLPVQQPYKQRSIGSRCPQRADPDETPPLFPSSPRFLNPFIVMARPGIYFLAICVTFFLLTTYAECEIRPTALRGLYPPPTPPPPPLMAVGNFQQQQYFAVPRFLPSFSLHPHLLFCLILEFHRPFRQVADQSLHQPVLRVFCLFIPPTNPLIDTGKQLAFSPFLASANYPFLFSQSPTTSFSRRFLLNYFPLVFLLLFTGDSTRHPHLNIKKFSATAPSSQTALAVDMVRFCPSGSTNLRPASFEPPPPRSSSITNFFQFPSDHWLRRSNAPHSYVRSLLLLSPLPQGDEGS